MIAVWLAWSTPAYAQDSYTSAEFLERPIDSQDAFMLTSITMIGVVATQVRPEIARCIDDWYGGEAMAERNSHIRSVMREHSEFHPSGVVLAVVQQACGRLGEG